jgi:hypothetical protein
MSPKPVNMWRSGIKIDPAEVFRAGLVHDIGLFDYTCSLP